MAMARSDVFQTTLCRLSYAQSLFRARAAAEGAPKRFGATLIFPKLDRPTLEKYVADVIVAEWGPKGIEKAKAGLIKSPFLAGDGKEARNKQSGDLHPGMGADVFFIRAQAGENRPPWVRGPKDKNRQATEEEVYSGCYGRAVINCFAWHNAQSGDGVSFGIAGFQKHLDGERLGGSGGSDPDKWTETVEDSGPAPDATKTGAGASGLFAD
jgi:hypothetical protein